MAKFFLLSLLSLGVRAAPLRLDEGAAALDAPGSLSLHERVAAAAREARSAAENAHMARPFVPHHHMNATLMAQKPPAHLVYNEPEETCPTRAEVMATPEREPFSRRL